MLRRLLTVSLIEVLTTGCFHWSHVESLDEVAGAERVRIEPSNGQWYVLEKPSVDRVRDAVIAEHARVAVRKLDGWATAGLIGVGVLVTLPFVAVLIFETLIVHPIHE